MLLLAQVTKWVDNRDSTKRVHKRDGAYRWYLLNPSRFVDIKDLSTLVIAKASCLFSDNHRDRREGNSYMELLKSPAQIRTAHDTAYFSKFITLPFYPKNNPHKTAVNTTIDVEDIAYFDDYNDPNHPNCCWLIYNRKGFKRVEQLVGYSLEQVEDVAETGTTSTTTTTEEQR